MCDITENEIFTLDISTPNGNPLSALYSRSFAYYTTRVRWPNILKTIIQNLKTELNNIIRVYGTDAKTDIYFAIQQIEELIEEILFNKELEDIDSQFIDAQLWNDALMEERAKTSDLKYYTMRWLLSECYIYRKLNTFFEKTKLLKDYDMFEKGKVEAFMTSFEAFASLADYTLKLVQEKSNKKGCIKQSFIDLFKLNLWSNQYDLSLSCAEEHSDGLTDLLARYESQILVDDSDKVYTIVKCPKLFRDIIGFVNDNAGYELFCDCCLADFFLSYNFCKEIHFFTKLLPWFVSDAMEKDIYWLIEQLIESKQKHLLPLGLRWNKYLRHEKWKIIVDNYWTLPYGFTYMPKKRPDLYQRLQMYKILIIKGDLNYRKLLNDINVVPVTPFTTAVGSFHPCNFCVLRTIKSEVVCGLPPGVAEQLDLSDPQWKMTGKYGLIQYDGDLT